MTDIPENVMMEGVVLLFRNFEGREDKFNDKGKRNFSVVLSPDIATAMANDNWNIRTIEAREDGDEPTFLLPVSLRYDIKPPHVVSIAGDKRTNLNEETVGSLDHVDIKNCDLVVRPYFWTMPSGKSGIKAYLKTMFVTIDQDELERKYSQGDNSPSSNL